MLLGYLLDMIYAKTYILFDAENKEVIGRYNNKNEIQDEYKNAYVMEISSPGSTKWYCGDGVMHITIKFGNF